MSEFVDPSRAIHHSPLRRLSPMYAALVPLSRCVDVAPLTYFKIRTGYLFHFLLISFMRKRHYYWFYRKRFLIKYLHVKTRCKLYLILSLFCNFTQFVTFKNEQLLNNKILFVYTTSLLSLKRILKNAFVSNTKCYHRIKVTRTVSTQISRHQTPGAHKMSAVLNLASQTGGCGRPAKFADDGKWKNRRGGRIDGKLFWQWTKENGHRISCGQAKRRFSNHYIICRAGCLAFMYSWSVRCALLFRLPTSYLANAWVIFNYYKFSVLTFLTFLD